MYLCFLLSLPPLIFSTNCYNRFPLKETVDTVKALVNVYGKPAKEIDSDGTEWVNLLILRRFDGYEINGVTYYLNDNSLPPEQTFYFNQRQFLFTPVYVVDVEKEKSWRSIYPDQTEELARISFSCPSNQRACGLRCCPEGHFDIQKLFANKIASGKIQESTIVSLGDITYSLTNKNVTCAYTLSYYDTILKRNIDGQEATIYFNCPQPEDCCGLTCSYPPKTAESRQPPEQSITRIIVDSKSCGLIVGSIMVLLLFGLVTFRNWKYHRSKARSHKSSPSSTPDEELSMFQENNEKENVKASHSFS